MSAASFDPPTKPDLFFVVGPTACGKSDLAVELAEQLTGRHPSAAPSEIINCDSIQFFAGVEIGAAKPGADLLARVPHHLIGHVPTDATYTAGSFRRDALAVIEKRVAAGVQNFVAVGGSGFHVQALEKGMFDVPGISEDVREQLKQEADRDLAPLFEELKKRDPESTIKIKPNDRYRILRALEVLRTVGGAATLSSIRDDFNANRPPAPFGVHKVGLFRPREILRQRVTERTHLMLKGGFIEEVERLRTQGFGASTPLMSVGYFEIQQMLDGKLPRQDLVQAIVTSTMQLAKRQMTWFKRDPDIKWFDVEAGSQDPLASILKS